MNRLETHQSFFPSRSSNSNGHKNKKSTNKSSRSGRSISKSKFHAPLSKKENERRRKLLLILYVMNPSIKKQIITIKKHYNLNK